MGARVLKTGIAVTVALYVSMLLKQPSPVIAAVAAIFAMQPSIYRSWRYFLEQLQANTLGAVIALLAGMAFSNEPVTIGLICIVVIMICLKLKMEETIGLTLVTVILVMEASGQFAFALDRFLQVIIGITAACLINIIFFPPNPRVQFMNQVDTVFNRMSLLLRTVISDEMRESAFREEKQALEDGIKSLSEKYKLFEEESKKLRRAKYSRSRQIVIYKQLLHTLHKGLEVLEAIEGHYFQSTPSREMDIAFDKHLEMLIKGHELVLLKLEDKVKPDTNDMDVMEEKNAVFLHRMMEQFSQCEEGMRRLSIVAAACYEYGFQISRLDRLVGHGDKVLD